MPTVQMPFLRKNLYFAPPTYIKGEGGTTAHGRFVRANPIES